jgi:hypothetical protein
MLSDEERSILEFERAWWHESGPKEQAIEFRLGVSASEYYEQLLQMVAKPEAFRLDPLTVARVRAMIEPDQAGAETAS